MRNLLACKVTSPAQTLVGIEGYDRQTKIGFYDATNVVYLKMYYHDIYQCISLFPVESV